jgi:uncharacterized membrane protein YeaQ/YmgE (transglycosylase-associated protein family)
MAKARNPRQCLHQNSSRLATRTKIYLAAFLGLLVGIVGAVVGEPLKQALMAFIRKKRIYKALLN